MATIRLGVQLDGNAQGANNAVNSTTQAIRNLGAASKEAAKELDRLKRESAQSSQEAARAVNAAAAAARAAQSAAEAARSAVNASRQGSANAAQGINGITASLGKLAAAYFSINGAARLFGEILEKTRAYDRVEKGLEAVTGSSELADAQMQKLSKTAAYLGQNYEALARGSLQMTAAASESNLKGAETEKLFTAVAAAMSKLGAPAQSSERAFYALSQMISKGTLSMEEIRLQLGDVLPGTLNLFAKATGMTTAEFQKMVGEGKLLAEDVLPKFRRVLEEKYMTGNFDSLENAIQRINNKFSEGLVVAGEYLQVSKTIKGFADFIGAGVPKAEEAMPRVTDFGYANAVEKAKTELAKVEEELTTATNMANFYDDGMLKTYYQRSVEQLTNRKKELLQKLAFNDADQELFDTFGSTWTDAAMRSMEKSGSSALDVVAGGIIASREKVKASLSFEKLIPGDEGKAIAAYREKITNLSSEAEKAAQGFAKKIALGGGSDKEVAQLKFELDFGSLKDLSSAEKDYLTALAQVVEKQADVAAQTKAMGADYKKLEPILTGKYREQITASALKYGVDPNLMLAIAQKESASGRNAVKSSAGALGVMQIMPDTATHIAQLSKGQLSPSQILGSTQGNIEGSAIYLKYIQDEIAKRGIEPNARNVAGAYNAGLGNMGKAKFNLAALPKPQETVPYANGVEDYYEALTKVSGGVDQISESWKKAKESEKQAADEARQLIEQSLTPVQKYNKAVERANELKAQGELSESEYSAVLDMLGPKMVDATLATDEYREAIKSAEEQQKKHTEAVKELEDLRQNTAYQSYLANMAEEMKMHGATAEAIQHKIDVEKMYLDIRARNSVVSPEEARKLAEENVSANEKLQNVTSNGAMTTQAAWESAAKNIQSSWADFLFNPMEKGFDGLLISFADMVKRMVAEAAAAQLTSVLFGENGGKGKPLAESGIVGSVFSGIGSLFTGSLMAADGAAFSAAGVPVNYFADGGIVDSPTPFKYSGGLGVMGEAGAEAILPLKRGNGGKLGVVADIRSGGGDVSVHTVVNVNGKGDEGNMKKLGNMINSEVKRIIATEKRPGGLLA